MVALAKYVAATFMVAQINAAYNYSLALQLSPYLMHHI